MFLDMFKQHPAGLKLLFFTEMWERFSYYGMRALLSLFMINALLYDKATASEIYGYYTALVYLTPLLGGYIADRYWGNRHSIVAGGSLMAIGQFALFASGSFYSVPELGRPFFFVGLAFLILGNGFFKPNISTMVGSLYPPGDRRRDSAYTIFYMGVNLGALLSPLVCGYLGDTGNPADFKWGFFSAGVGMVLGIITFISLRDKYLVTPEGIPIGTAPKGKSQTDIAELNRKLTRVDYERIALIFILAVFVIAFWTAFEQAGISLTFFAEEQTDRVLFGWTIPASYFQSINPVMIMILAPMFAGLWIWLGDRGMEPSSPTKMAFGILLVSLGYVFILGGVSMSEGGGKVSPLWLVGLYTIHTMGELCLSPIGLSMVNKLAPVKFASLLMGVWYLANVVANFTAGQLSALYPDPANPVKPELFGTQITNLTDFFTIFIIFAGVASAILFLITKRLQKMMHGVN
ncbi:MAG: peptide MFS transporter [Bacteroidetes bacterium]|nr:peptide MFS transporter [Bacteroidota bacterium]